jgi:autotransporter strand-loop-strand O-heptosyltransferase
MKIKISYVTELPVTIGGPLIYFFPESEEELNQEYTVSFYDIESESLVNQIKVLPNKPLTGDRQWFTKWRITITDSNNNLIGFDNYNAENKVVFIKCDSWGIGDTLAWVPYFEEFRKKHNCKLIVSTFYNEFFITSYPEIMFVKPNTKIWNIYAQYYVGTLPDINKIYAPSNHLNKPLQRVASDILGLEYKEIKPNIGMLNFPKQKKITLSEFTSGKDKDWGTTEEWQQIVDLFVEKGYEVVVISKEPTQLKNITDKTGDISLDQRAIEIATSEYHIGSSTGLSWLAWACNTEVFLISDFTPPSHEFPCYRIFNIENPAEQVLSSKSEHPTSINYVIEEIKKVLK